MFENRCAVGRALDQLGKDDRIEAEAILANGVNSVIIAHVMTYKYKFDGCTTAAVNRHRKQECGCE